MTILNACSNFPPMTKNGYIKNFVEFINDVELNHTQYTSEQWDKADEKFRKYAETYYEKFKAKMGSEEIRKVNILKGKYIGFKIKGKSGQLLKDVLSTFKDIVDESNGLLESLDLGLDSLDFK